MTLNRSSEEEHGTERQRCSATHTLQQHVYLYMSAVQGVSVSTVDVVVVDEA